MGELKKIIILFDCPCEENDKKWLYDELQKIYGTSGTDVIPLYTKNALAVLKNSGKRVSYLIQGLKLSAEAIQKSRGGGSLVCWGVTTGFITNFLSRILGNSREILAMNWLTPINPPFLAIWLRRMMVNNRRCRIIVNSVESKDKWLKVLRVKDRGNIYFIPDTYDSQIEFQRPYRRKNVYCFTGGENNRDWKFLMKIAEQMPEMEFICAAYEADTRECKSVLFSSRTGILRLDERRFRYITAIERQSRVWFNQYYACGSIWTGMHFNQNKGYRIILQRRSEKISAGT